MNIRYDLHENGPAIIYIQGPLTTQNASEFRSTADLVFARGKNVIVLDAREVDFVSSDGLYALVQTHRTLRDSGGYLLIMSPKPELNALFRAIGMHGEFTIAHTHEEARTITENSGAGGFYLTRNGQPPAETYIHQPVESGTAVAEQPMIPEGENIFNKPVVIECEECQAYVRIHSSGQFLCPSCHTEFVVEKDGTVVF